MARIDLSYFNSIKIYKITKEELKEFPEKLLNGENVLSRDLLGEGEENAFYLYTLSYKQNVPYLLAQKMPKHLENMTPEIFAINTRQLADGFRKASGIPPVTKRKANKKTITQRLFGRAR